MSRSPRLVMDCRDARATLRPRAELPPEVATELATKNWQAHPSLERAAGYETNERNEGRGPMLHAGRPRGYGARRRKISGCGSGAVAPSARFVLMLSDPPSRRRLRS